MFAPLLQKMVDNCDGALAGVLMGFDGMAIEVVSRTDLEIGVVGMEFSFVLTQVRKAAEILEAGVLQEVTIRTEKLTFIARVLSEDHFLGLALSPQGNFGKGRFLMRLTAPDLQAKLT